MNLLVLRFARHDLFLFLASIKVCVCVTMYLESLFVTLETVLKQF